MLSSPEIHILIEPVYTLQTIASTAESEYKDRGSKFLGYAYPIGNTDEIKQHIKDLKKIHPKAIHFCFAWRLGTDQTQYRAGDDGEPSGSAGKPILGQIDSLELTNTLVVVVRYWGGSLLGVPGLIMAYKTAAHDALIKAGRVTKNIEVRYTISFDYTIQNEVMRIVKSYPCTILKFDQQLFIELLVGIPLVNQDEVVTKLTELRNVTITKGSN